MADKAIPQREFDQRKNDAAEVARADLTTARLNLEYTQVKSPISGRASRAEITVGNLVEAGSGAPILTSVVSSSPIYADFEIDENTYLRYVQAGASGKGCTSAQIPVMMGLAGEDGTPHVRAISNPSTTALTSPPAPSACAPYSIMPTAHWCRVCSRASAWAAPARPRRCSSPTARWARTRTRNSCYVVGADNKVEHREVTLGGRMSSMACASWKDGLKPGEKIIVSGLQRVMMPGQPVTPEVVPMDARPFDVSARPCQNPDRCETCEIHANTCGSSGH